MPSTTARTGSSAGTPSRCAPPPAGCAPGWRPGWMARATPGRRHSAELAAAAADHRRGPAAQRAAADAAAFAASPGQRQAHLAAIRVTLATRRRSA